MGMGQISVTNAFTGHIDVSLPSRHVQGKYNVVCILLPSWEITLSANRYKGPL